MHIINKENSNLLVLQKSKQESVFLSQNKQFHMVHLSVYLLPACYFLVLVLTFIQYFPGLILFRSKRLPSCQPMLDKS